MRITGELLETRVAPPVYKTEINCRGGSAAAGRATALYPQKLALNSLAAAVGQSVQFACARSGLESQD
jgi:hypothetical protein